MVDNAVPSNQRRFTQQLEREERDASQSTPIENDLAPTDRGPAAWKLLWTAFVFEALLWGTTHHTLASVLYYYPIIIDTVQVFHYHSGSSKTTTPSFQSLRIIATYPSLVPLPRDLPISEHHLFYH